MLERRNTDEIVNQAIEEFGLPNNTTALGFVVHLKESDEFLADSKKSKWMDERKWSKIPDIAKIYSQKKAIKEAVRYGNQACIGLLLDTESKYLFLECFSAKELNTYYDKSGRRKKVHAVK